MSIGEATKETVKWIMSIVGAMLLFSIKYGVDSSTTANEELKQKVDKVYDYATNHEIRMIVIEKELEDHKQKILDLQLAQERYMSGGSFLVQKSK